MSAFQLLQSNSQTASFGDRQTPSPLSQTKSIEIEIEDDQINPNSKEDFDKLLFASDHMCIEGLSQSLILRSSKQDKIKNAKEIFLYYFHHHKLNDLLIWSFEKEFTNQSIFKNNQFEFESDSLFIVLYTEYVRNFLKDYIILSFKPVVLSLLNKSENKRLSVSTGLQSINLENSEATSNDYRLLKTFFGDLLTKFNDNLINNVEKIPHHFSVFIQSLNASVKSLIKGKDGFSIIFRNLFFNYTLVPILTNTDEILPKRSSIDSITDKYKIDFFINTLSKLYISDRNTIQDRFVFEILPMITNPDPSQDLINYFLEDVDIYDKDDGSENSEETEDEDGLTEDQRQMKQFKSFASLIRDNIMSTLDHLPKRIGDNLMKLVGISTYIFDDYQVYDFLTDKIQLFNEFYNCEMFKSTALLKQKMDQIQILEKQFDALQKELDSIQNTNMELQQKIESLRPFQYVLSSEEKYHRVSFDMYFHKHLESMVQQMNENNEVVQQENDDKSKKIFGLFRKNNKKGKKDGQK